MYLFIPLFLFFTHPPAQLREHGVFNTGEQIEEGGMGVLLRLIDLPSTKGLSTSTILALRKHLLSASIRMQVAVAWVSAYSLCFIIGMVAA